MFIKVALNLIRVLYVFFSASFGLSYVESESEKSGQSHAVGQTILSCLLYGCSQYFFTINEKGGKRWNQTSYYAFWSVSRTVKH